MKLNSSKIWFFNIGCQRHKKVLYYLYQSLREMIKIFTLLKRSELAIMSELVGGPEFLHFTCLGSSGKNQQTCEPTLVSAFSHSLK